MQELCYNNATGSAKVKYRSRAAAEKAARKTKSGLGLRIYVCKWCRKYHLTSQAPQNKVEAIPSAAKLRRQLENAGREIAAQQRRIQEADEQLARQTAKAEEIQRRAEAAHAEELAYVRRETDRLMAGRQGLNTHDRVKE